MDPENQVVKCCVAGMAAEGRGDLDEAQRLFTEAWERAADVFEQCIAAHYLARHQPNPQETLRWNQMALQLADTVGDERVADFYPSLLLNLGHSYELLGQLADARHYYEQAAARAEHLSPDRYGNMVRDGAAAGYQRVASEVM